MNNFIKYFLVAILFFFIGYSFQDKYTASFIKEILHFYKLEKIKNKKQLHAIVVNTHTVFYYGHSKKEGFEYELLKAYADDIGVKLNLKVVSTISEALKLTKTGFGDITSAAITRTADRENEYIFGPSYYQVQQQVICSRKLFKKGKFPNALEDLIGLSIMVGESTSYERSLLDAKAKNPNIMYEVSTEFSSSQLLEMVSKDKIDCTIADSNIFSINQRYYPSLSFAFSISERESLSWVLRENSDTLINDMYRWLNTYIQNGDMAKLKDKYYGHINIFDYYNTVVFHKRIKARLPKYKKYFIAAAKENDISWIYLAAQSYQESHWNSKARSYTGVRGIMMLTRTTAKTVGVKNRLNAKENIFGGAKYMAKMIKDVPKDVENKDDRMKFALAAYNVGMGHIHDARVLAKRLHKNPNSWLDIREILPLLTQKKYYRTLKYGYARGAEPVKYVDGISEYANILTQALNKQKENLP